MHNQIIIIVNVDPFCFRDNLFFLLCFYFIYRVRSGFYVTSVVKLTSGGSILKSGDVYKSSKHDHHGSDSEVETIVVQRNLLSTSVRTAAIFN